MSSRKDAAAAGSRYRRDAAEPSRVGDSRAPSLETIPDSARNLIAEATRARTGLPAACLPASVRAKNAATPDSVVPGLATTRLSAWARTALSPIICDLTGCGRPRT